MQVVGTILFYTLPITKDMKWIIQHITTVLCESLIEVRWIFLTMTLSVSANQKYTPFSFKFLNCNIDDTNLLFLIINNFNNVYKGIRNVSYIIILLFINIIIYVYT